MKTEGQTILQSAGENKTLRDTEQVDRRILGPQHSDAIVSALAYYQKEK